MYGMKKRHYQLVSSNNAASLTEQVQEKLDEGWKQWGSPFSHATLDEQGHSLYQAVIIEYTVTS